MHGFTELAVGRALKKRCDTDPSSPTFARTTVEPAQYAYVFVCAWQEKPLGPAVVVPMTCCRFRDAFVVLAFRGERVPVFANGEFEGEFLKGTPLFFGLLRST